MKLDAQIILKQLKELIIERGFEAKEINKGLLITLDENSNGFTEIEITRTMVKSREITFNYDITFNSSDEKNLVKLTNVEEENIRMEVCYYLH